MIPKTSVKIISRLLFGFSAIAIVFLSLFSKIVLAHDSYADAVERSIDSVVIIYTQEYANESTFISFNPQTNRLERVTKQPYLHTSGLGSGIILDSVGHIVTNYHVIKNADEIFMKLELEGQEFPVEIVGYDSESDIALLKIKFEEIKNNILLKPIRVANSDNLRMGDVVLAIGNPFGIGKTVTKGIISGTNRNNLGINTFEDFIQIDAAINRGNSGGALIDTQGDLIGINSAIYSDDGSFAGLAFAIPSNMLLEIVDQLKRFGQVIRGWIGVQISELEEAISKGLHIEHGVVITSVLDNSPAFRAGLQVGDVVTEVEGEVIKNTRHMINMISNLKPGSEANLKVFRNINEINLSIIVRQRPNFIR